MKHKSSEQLGKMPRYYSEVVNRYFNHWIMLTTWHTKHSNDMKRFYQFLKALKRYSRKRSKMEGLYENILKAAKQYHPEFDESYIKKMAGYFIEQAKIVFDYDAAPFPNALVERTDPIRFSLDLEAIKIQDAEGNIRNLYSFEEREEIVTREFGEDWQEWEKAQSIINAHKNRDTRRLDHRQQVKHLVRVGNAHHTLRQEKEAKNCYERALTLVEEELPNKVQVIEKINEKLAVLTCNHS